MNINRYKHIDFHRSKEVSKKIEALFLLYDKQCEDSKIKTYIGKIILINHFIKTLIDKEEFEVAVAFIERKRKKQFKYKNARRVLSFQLLYRFNKIKIREKLFIWKEKKYRY